MHILHDYKTSLVYSDHSLLLFVSFELFDKVVKPMTLVPMMDILVTPRRDITSNVVIR